MREIGSRLELFVDDWLIETMKGVELKLHRPVPREVVLEFDRPWEGPLSYAPAYLTEGDRYRLWYRGGGVWDGIRADRRPEPCTCYAESRDGIHWERPVLGIHETRGIRGFEPSRDNNIVIHGSTAKHVCVFKDGNPAAPESERYKAIGLSSGFDPPGTLRGLVSPDGLHWTVLDKDPILTAPGDDHWPHFDSHNTALWDPNLGQYVAYMRGMDPRFGVFETYPPGNPLHPAQRLARLQNLVQAPIHRVGRFTRRAPLHERQQPVLPGAPPLPHVPQALLSGAQGP